MLDLLSFSIEFISSVAFDCSKPIDPYFFVLFDEHQVGSFRCICYADRLK
jgi:hypothetical protein